MQTRWHSLLESVLGTAIGLVIALASQIIIFPWFGIHVSMSDHLLIVMYFTIISVARVYLMRRYFDKIMVLLRGYFDKITGFTRKYFDKITGIIGSVDKH